MLPAATYQAPAAIVLLIAGGFLACFSGYRLFKVVLGVFGFIIGALAASSIFGASDTTPMVIAARRRRHRRRRRDAGGLLRRRGAGRRRASARCSST